MAYEENKVNNYLQLYIKFNLWQMKKIFYWG
jgi:hypothetical protein